MAEPALLDRRLVIVTGKGGTGKSTLSAGRALRRLSAAPRASGPPFHTAPGFPLRRGRDAPPARDTHGMRPLLAAPRRGGVCSAPRPGEMPPTGARGLARSLRGGGSPAGP